MCIYIYVERDKYIHKYTYIYTCVYIYIYVHSRFYANFKDFSGGLFYARRQLVLFLRMMHRWIMATGFQPKEGHANRPQGQPDY